MRTRVSRPMSIAAVAALLVTGCGSTAPASQAPASVATSQATGVPPTAAATPQRTVPPTQATSSVPSSSETPSTPAASGGSGGIDEAFGDRGLVVTDMGGTDDHARGVVVADDGTITVVGEARPDAGSLVGFALSRYKADGTLDPSFGTGGKTYTAFGEFQGSGAHAAAFQDDGKLVVVGFGRHPEKFHDTFAVARYDAAGKLDRGFGEQGQLLTAIDPQTGAGRNDIAHGVAVDDQGRIVVVGETGELFKDFAIARYVPDGKLDASFGEKGVVVTDIGGDDRANSVAILPDGRILVGGSGWRPGGADDFVVARYLPDGTLDATFGEGGAVTTDFRGGSDKGYGLAVRPDGTILLGGTGQLSGGCSPSTCERYGFGLAQYTAEGALDTTFADAGLAFPDFVTSSGAYGAALLPDGSTALAGHIGNEDFGLALADEGGGPIQIEGGEGARIDFSGGSDRAFAVAPGPDGTVVLAGDASDVSGAFDFGLARYRMPASP